MATLSDYTSGTISLANGSATVTGTGTLFEVTRFREGDTLQIQNLTAVIASVDSNTQLTLAEPWTGASIVNGAYRARQLGDGSRVSTQAATIIELLGNGVLTNLAELGVEEGKVPVGGPTGEYELVDTSTFGIQDPNGSLGKLAALTLEASKILNTDATGELTQSDLTGFARSMLDDPDGATVWATMGGVAETGRIVFPTGMVLMMGTLNSPPEGAGLAILPTAFPNNMIGVSASLTNPTGSNYARMITAYTYNRFAFNVATQAIFNGGALQYDGNIPFSFLAWGN